MLSFEVMGPDGTLSTVLIATPYWRDASWRESWQAATGTAAYSCDRMAAALLLRLGGGWLRRLKNGIGFRQ
jgi:hypothetical protein